MALHLLNCTVEEVSTFGATISKMRNEIIYCRICGNISEHEICGICADVRRDHSVACVVEDIRDVMAIEQTGQYQGVYHVLGGIISPMEGIGPQHINIERLIERVAAGSIREIIFALPTTIEGDTTNFFLFKKLNGYPVRLTMIARGISVGDELEHTDEVTLGRSIVNRTPYESFLKHK